MDNITTGLMALVSLISVFGLLGIAADRWGVDSRPTIGDNHAR